MTDFKTFSLQSGSNGNCIYIEANNTKILVDAGLSGKHVKSRLASHDVDADDIDAVLISHSHSDHMTCAGVYNRMFRADLWMTPGTQHSVSSRIGRVNSINHIEGDSTFKIGGLTIEAISTPHDVEDGVCFIIDSGKNRVGVMTDLGHVFKGLDEAVCSLDGVYLESNFDSGMPEKGPYPWFLKKRIKGTGGHISNEECAKLLKNAFNKKLKWAVLAHLSAQNNSPRVAMNTARRIVGENRQISVAGRYDVTPVFEV